MYLYQPIDWLFEHQDTNLDVDISYFSLEMSKEAKMRQAMSYRLFSKYNKLISPRNLISVFNDYILEDDIEKLLLAEKEWFDFFEKKVTFYDTVRNPYGIYTTIREKCEREGSYSYKEMEWIENGTSVVKRVRDKYIPNNPDKINIVLTDHVGLLLPERGETLYEAIGKFSSRYCLEMRDLWKCSVVNVQQQAPTSEQQQYSMIGGTIIDKVRPSADGLGDNKGTSRDCNLMISLFHPKRYRVKNYNGIDLMRMGDHHREFFINLNRDGINNSSVDLFFQGASNYFEEIPKTNLENYYSKIEQFKGNF